jgi:hypothetical protein
MMRKPNARLFVVSIAVSALAFAISRLPALGQAGDPTSVVQMDYSNPGLSPSHWVLTLHPDGRGHFHSDRANAAQAAGNRFESDRSVGIIAPDVDRDIQVTQAFAGHTFQVARQHNLFSTDCDSHMKVAFQGIKKLSYSGPDGEGSCEFNYAKDKEIGALGDSLLAVGSTILEGAKLEKLMVHDRLGLDSEMDYLAEASKDGRVQQLGSIQQILMRLVEEPGIMERVKKRARMMLSGIQK